MRDDRIRSWRTLKDKALEKINSFDDLIRYRSDVLDILWYEEELDKLIGEDRLDFISHSTRDKIKSFTEEMTPVWIQLGMGEKEEIKNE